MSAREILIQAIKKHNEKLIQIITSHIYDELDTALSCCEDLELTEGVENPFLRGKIKAYEEVLDFLRKVERTTKI